jgi:hypothetical protein
MSSITLTPEHLKFLDAPDVDFPDSDFFKKSFELPDPETVIMHAELQRPPGFDLHDEEKDEGLWGCDTQWLWRRRPVVFPELNLLVKWGGTVRRENGLTMVAVRKTLPDVPVPEVYGWRTYGHNVFLYMELIDERTLDSSLKDMTVDDRMSIILDLQTILDELARLKQDVNDPFIVKMSLPSETKHRSESSNQSNLPISTGSIMNTHVFDKVLFLSVRVPCIEPFPSAREFHDWMTNDREETAHDGIAPALPDVDPHRGDLPDSVGIRFTHGDLQPSDVIISTTRPYRFVGLVDWEEAGWMPAYWEACKAHFKSLLVNYWDEKILEKLFGEERNEKVHIEWRWYIENFHSF